MTVHRERSGQRSSTRHTGPLAGVLLTALSLTATPVLTQAAPSHFWICNRPADYVEAELDGVTLKPDGTLSTGYQSRAFELPGADVAWSIIEDGDGALVGTGHSGLLYRIRGNTVSALDSTGSGQILCLARGPDGATYAGTGPDGRVLRIEGDRIETFFQSEQSYVWSLAWSGDVLFAATGPEGNLYRISRAGSGEIVFRSPEGQLTALTGDNKGGVFLASSGRGIVFWHTGGSTRALFEAPESEIRSLAYDDTALYAAAMAISPVQVETGKDNQLPRVTTTKGNKSTPTSTVYRIVPDQSVTPWWSPPGGLIFSLAIAPGRGLLAATGQQAGLHIVDARGRGEIAFLAGKGDVTGLAASSPQTIWWVMSNPTRVYRLEPRNSTGVIRSEVLDAETFSRWGRLTAEGTLNRVEFATRSGNTVDPDTTWSPWQSVKEGATISSPAGRYLQWRARISPGGSVEEVRIAFVDVNQAPRIEEFTVEPLPGQFYRGELSPRQEPVTQMLADGQRVQFTMMNPPPGELEALPGWARGLRPIAWKVSDANEDPLRYKLEYHRADGGEWVLVVEDLEAPSYAWDTSALPERDYIVRLTASDSPLRGEEALTDQVQSRPVRVDLTAPGLRLDAPRVEIRDVVLTGSASDGGGLYVRMVEASTDGDSWRPATPADGIWDGIEESFTVRLDGFAPGVHAVRIRAIDAVGNTATQTVEVSINP
jgi:hypothetical protein